MSSFLQPMTDNENCKLLELKKFELVWTLREIDIREGLRSDSDNGNTEEHSWYLLIKKIDRISNGRAPIIFCTVPTVVMHVQLCLKECPISEIFTRFRFVLKKSDNVMYETSGSFIFSGMKQSNPYPLFLESIQPNEEFTICVTVHAEDNSRPTITKHNLQFRNMRDLLSSLQCDSDWKDVVIKVDGKEINCHKCVLSSKSSYFTTMFKSGMSESITNQIEITDFDYETIKTMVDFLYVFECPELPVVSTLRLMEAAHKYQINDLKDICAEQVMSNIDASNALDVLLHADTYSADNVKKKAIDFIWKNPTSFKQAENYEPFMARPHILRDLLLAKMDETNTS